MTVLECSGPSGCATSAVGGSTSLTVTFDPGNDCMACLLMELTGMPPINIADILHKQFSIHPVGINQCPCPCGRCGLLCVFLGTRCPARTPAAGWTQVFSDTSGAGAME